MSEERTLFCAIAQGQMPDLLKSGIFNQPMLNPYSTLIEGAQIIFLRGEDVNLLSLVSECKLTHDEWAEIREVWREAKGEENINWHPAAERLIQRNLIVMGEELAAKMAENIARNPATARQVLTSANVQIQTMLDASHAYNPSPSHHYENGNIGQVLCSSGLHRLDNLLQGGFWTQALIIAGIPSNHGKSTLGYTLLGNIANRQKRGVLFTFETNTATAVARILSAYGGFTVGETLKRQGSTPERDDSMRVMLKEIDQYISIYDNSFNDPKKMEAVIRLERPSFAVIDHLGMIDPRMAMKNASRFDQIGDTADAALQWTINYGLTILMNSQLSDAVSKDLKKNHNLDHAQLFGSSRVYNAADFVLIGMRHWLKPNTAYFRSKKNRKNGIVDLDCELQHDPLTQTYFEG